MVRVDPDRIVPHPLIYNSPWTPLSDGKAKMNDETNINLASGISAFESKQFSRAIQLLNPLAESGEAEALYRCAIMFQNGLGITRNEKRAFDCMSAAANQGHALAQHGLGFMYMEGDCVTQDGERAVKWFTDAAEQGLTGSQTTLAMIYEQGNGVEADPEKARKWYQRAGFDEFG